MSHTMRIATFNIRHGAVAGGRQARVDLLAEACASLHADVLALQEVDVGTQRTGGADLVRVAAEATGLTAAFGATLGRSGGGQYGNALLARGQLTAVEVLRLPQGWRFWARREPRNAIIAETVPGDGGVRLSVAATHLSVQRWASREQLPAVVRAVGHRPNPRVLLGDLNRTTGEVGRTRALRGYELAGGPPTFTNRNPRVRIDHIAVTGASIVAVDVVPTAVSDHRALVATIEVPNSTQ